MAMEGLSEVVPPSDRVPGQLLLAAPILKWRQRRYREENRNSRSILGVSSAGTKYRPKGPQGSQEGARRALGGARDPPGALVGPLPSILGSSGSFRYADFLYNFSRIYFGTFNGRKT